MIFAENSNILWSMTHEDQNPSSENVQGMEEEAFTMLANLAAGMGVEIGKGTGIADILDTLDTARLPEDALKALNQSLEMLQRLDTSLS